MCLLWISEPRATISCTILTDWMFKLRLCVYCAVRTESSDIIRTVVSPKPGHAIAQADSCRSLTAEARVRSQFSPCEMIYVGQ